MPFPPAKKKPGMDVMIAVGAKPKGGDLSAPGPLDGKPAADEPDQPDHEAAETPDQEGSEEYGAKLLSDLTKPLVDLGLPEEHAKTTLAQIFRAAADCLDRGGDEPDMGAAEPDAMGGSPYGR